MSQPQAHPSDPPRPAKGRGQRHGAAFRREAMRLVTEERYTIVAAAAAVGIYDRTLRKWLSKARPAPEPCGDNPSVEQLKKETRRLRQQLKRAEIEREVLKIAMDYFARRPPPPLRRQQRRAIAAKHPPDADGFFANQFDTPRQRPWRDER